MHDQDQPIAGGFKHLYCNIEPFKYINPVKLSDKKLGKVSDEFKLRSQTSSDDDCGDISVITIRVESDSGVDDEP